MEKFGVEMEQISRKMQIPQKKIQELSIEMQEASLAMQKLEMKYDDGKMPAEVKQKIADLQKRERNLEKQIRVYEQQMQKIEAEMLDSLSKLMERYKKPIDSLSKIMEEKGKVLEKLAKEEEARFKKDLESFAEMLYKDGLIKNKKDFEVRLKGDKLLIDLEPQSATVYEKVWSWMNKTWGSRYKDLQEKDLRINVNGDNVNFSTHGSRNYYRYGSTYPAPPAHPASPKAVVPVPPAPRNFRPSDSEVAPPPPPARVKTPATPKAPKPVRVGVVDKNFQITDALIRDDKGTCSVYVVSEKDGKSTAKAITATLANDKWTAKGLKVGDKVILKSDVKVINGDAVKLLAVNN